MLRSVFRKIAVSLVLATALGSASASLVETDLGVLNTTLTYSHKDITGEFADVVSFKANTLLGAQASVVGLDIDGNLKGSYRIGSGEHYKVVDWSDMINLPAANDDDIFAFTQQFPALESGKTYWFEIWGTMTDGSYSVTVAPYMIPEPGSLALVLAGVAAFGAAARRRKCLTSKAGS